MDEGQLVKDINKIITLEHVHLGMYSRFLGYKDKEISRTFRRFMEIEIEHINRLKNILYNLGVRPATIVESGDMMGKIFGITVKNIMDISEVLKAYRLIEKKSYQGYYDFIAKLDKDDELIKQFISEITFQNMLEADLMYLWLDNEIKKRIY